MFVVNVMVNIDIKSYNNNQKAKPTTANYNDEGGYRRVTDLLYFYQTFK